MENFLLFIYLNGFNGGVKGPPCLSLWYMVYWRLRMYGVDSIQTSSDRGFTPWGQPEGSSATLWDRSWDGIEDTGAFTTARVSAEFETTSSEA